MIRDEDINSQIDHVLARTALSFLGDRYEGKVRDNYSSGDVRYLITTDRLSCFDVVVTTIPFKGQVLNELAVHWFKLAGEIVPNHIIDIPDPNVIVAKNCQILPVELVVRAYLTGSAWRDYEAGKAISGIKLPAGMKASQKLDEPIVTPSTKAERGKHDLPISESEILSSGLVQRSLWERIREVSLQLFRLGQIEADRRGLLLVDTKYEFGLDPNGNLLLADEIHTLDSSRYWIKENYLTAFAKGESPQMLDKEPTRQWLLSKGYKGDGAIPEFTREHRIQISRHYIESFERISGHQFKPEFGSVEKRIEANLRKYNCKFS